MKKALIVLSILLFTAIQVNGQKTRDQIPEKYKWDLSVIYKNIDAWKADYAELETLAEKMSSFKGRLSESSQIFTDALVVYEKLIKGYYLVSDYAQRLGDEDLKISKNQNYVELATSLGTKISEAVSFMNPEILSIPADTISKYFAEQPRLKDFNMFVDNIQRLKKHTLSGKEENILATAGMLRSNPSTIHSIFENAEKPYPNITLSDGTKIELTSSAYTKYRTVPNRKDRALVFKSLFENYGKFKNTLGAILASKVKTDYFFAKSRKYDSVLEASLDANNIPVKVYENLVKQINKNLPTLHRFLKLKKRMLGVDTLHYYDLYTPIVKAVDMKFSVDEGQKLLSNLLNVLGDEYVATLRKAFNNRWIDYYPTPGKRSGAYSSGAAYDYHPYILMNWNDDYESLSTLAHELGHTMHSYFSNKDQPFIKSDYSIFVAEIASTCNESIMNDYLVKHSQSDDEKLYLLGSYLELLRTTIYRQTSFAEFEWEIHKRVENGKPLTGDVMSEIYYNIVKRYYGNDEGVCVVDPYIAYEWAYIPHFVHYSYYVYQYSTSLIYATAFAQKIIHEGEPAVKKYYKILKGGSSEYPIDLIKDAGIDPLGSEAFDLTIKRMNDVMDEIENILNNKK